MQAGQTNVVLLVCVLTACSGTEFSASSPDAAADSTAGSAGLGGASGFAGGGAAGSAGSTAGAAGSAGAGGAAGSQDAGLEACADCDASDGSVEDGPVEASDDGGSDADAVDGCPILDFFLDGDGDGYGGTTTTSGCVAPAGPWVVQGGDCHDGNPDVNPAQTSYFIVGYLESGSSEVSFDYDCSGHETEAGANPKASACKLDGMLQCTGGGYVVAQPVRTGLGVDPYCGSAQKVACNKDGLACKQSGPFGATAIACR